jgi:hypothetical protein
LSGKSAPDFFLGLEGRVEIQIHMTMAGPMKKCPSKSTESVFLTVWTKCSILGSISKENKALPNDRGNLLTSNKYINTTDYDAICHTARGHSTVCAAEYNTITFFGLTLCGAGG